MIKNAGQYSKAIVAALGALTSSLSVYYGTARWFPIVTAAVTVLVIYLVPNQPAPARPEPPKAP